MATVYGSEYHGNTIERLLSRKIRLTGTHHCENYTVYDVEVTCNGVTWLVQRRYSEFYELNEVLIEKYKLQRNLLPPKRLFGNKSQSFIKKRQNALEEYLMNLIFKYKTLPKILSSFLYLHKYEITGLCESLAHELYDTGELLLVKNSVISVTPLQLHAVSERVKIPLPTSGEDGDRRCDLGNVMDFICRVQKLRIIGHRGRIGTSSWEPHKLAFDMCHFKSLKYLEVENCIFPLISNFDCLKGHLTQLHVHHSINGVRDVFLPHWSEWLPEESTSSQPVPNITVRVPVWNDLAVVDFSNNKISTVDHSIKLVPNVQHLNLSNNNITDFGDLSCLSELVVLDLSCNLLRNLPDLHTRLGNVSHLNLSGNRITSLTGLSKLYSLKILNVSGNEISQVLDVLAVCSLPCLENIVLKGNPLTMITDYRKRVLENFGERASEVLLDNVKPTQKEMDTVAVLVAIQKSRVTSENTSAAAVAAKTTETHAHTKHKKKTRAYQKSRAAETETMSSSSSDAVISNCSAQGLNTGEDETLHRSITSIRRQAGEDWLKLYNEMQDQQPYTKIITAPSPDLTGTDPKLSNASKTPPDASDTSRTPGPSEGLGPSIENPDPRPVSPLLEERTEDHSGGDQSRDTSNECSIDCLKADDSNSHENNDECSAMPESGDIRVEGSQTGPESTDASSRQTEGSEISWKSLDNMTQDDGVKQDTAGNSEDSDTHYVLGLSDGPDSEDSVFRSLQSPTEDEEPARMQLKSKHSQTASVSSMSSVLSHHTLVATVECTLKSFEEAPMNIRWDELLSDYLILPECGELIVTLRTTLTKRDDCLSLVRFIDVYQDQFKTAADFCTLVNRFLKSELSCDPELHSNIEAFARTSIEPSDAHLMYHSVEIPRIDVGGTTTEGHEPTSVPLSDDPDPGIKTLTQLKNLSPSDLSRYFKNSVRRADDSSDDEVRYVIWSCVIPFTHPDTEIPSCVFLSSKALYLVTDSDLEIIRLAADQENVPTSKRERRHVLRCYCILYLLELCEVSVGLFNQCVRVSGNSESSTFAFITRNAETTITLLDHLKSVLSTLVSSSAGSPDHEGGGLYQSDPHDVYGRDVGHWPNNVHFSYATPENVSEIQFLINESLREPTPDPYSHSIVLCTFVYRELAADRRVPCTLVVTQQLVCVLDENYVSYPIPNFMKSLPGKNHFKMVDMRKIGDLRCCVMHSFGGHELVFPDESRGLSVDDGHDHFSARDNSAVGRLDQPEVSIRLIIEERKTSDKFLKVLTDQFHEICDTKLRIVRKDDIRQIRGPQKTP